MSTTDVATAHDGAPAQDNSADLVALGGELIPPAEMKRMWKVACMLANTKQVAEPLQGHPDLVMGVGLHLVRLGFPFDLVGIKMMHVWSDRKGVVMQLHYQAMIALAGRAGHDLWLAELEGDHATIGFANGRTRRETRFTYDLAMAATAGLLDKDERGHIKKENWRKNPHYALPAAAARLAVRFGCPEVLSGLDMSEDATVHVRPVTPDQIPAVPPPLDGGDASDVALEAGPAQDEAPAASPAPPAEQPDTWGAGPLPSEAESAEELAEFDRRRKAANAAMGEHGIRSDDARHEFVHDSTKGRTASTARLTSADLFDIIAAAEALDGDPGPVEP